MSPKPILLSVVALILTLRAVAQTDTLTARVCEWNKEPATPNNTGESRQVLKGTTHDLSVLDISAITLNAGPSITKGPKIDFNDELIIVKEGSLTITTPDSTKRLGPGGVALLPAGAARAFAGNSSAKTIYYMLRFQSLTENKTHPRQNSRAFFIDWSEMPVQHTAKGQTRQIFTLPTPWLTKIDMHATTLNPGESSHLPHTHRAEEIILMRSGHVQEYIDGRYYPAAPGDLIYLPSGSRHALENRSNERSEYFALQWLQ